MLLWSLNGMTPPQQQCQIMANHMIKLFFKEFLITKKIGLTFGIKRTITSHCLTLLSKMQMTPFILMLLLSYALSYDINCAILHGS